MVDNPNITWLRLPSGVMLHLIESQEAPMCPDNVHHAFEVEDFDAAMKALQEKGITIERTEVRHDGQRLFYAGSQWQPRRTVHAVRMLA
jgi:hypothetical protein